MIDFERFCSDHRIECADSTNSKVQDGWVGVHCPFCPPGHSKNFHLGYELTTGRCSCWRCGLHTELQVIKELTNLNWTKARKVQEDYGIFKARGKRVRKQKRDKFKFTDGVLHSLNKPCRSYLQDRGFDPEYLEDKFGLQTILKSKLYKQRIFIPVYYRGEIVTFQARDITDTRLAKYKNSEPEWEVMSIKDTLYNMDSVTDFALVVEGVTGVWGFGDGCVCTFGTNYTKAQLNKLRKLESVFVMFDWTDSNAIKMSEKLCDELSMFGVNAHHLEIKDTTSSDPGEMGQDEIDEIWEYVHAKR
jgi:hypothetical protein